MQFIERLHVLLLCTGKPFVFIPDWGVGIGIQTVFRRKTEHFVSSGINGARCPACPKVDLFGTVILLWA